MAVRLSLLRSVRLSVFSHVSHCKLHARAVPATSPRKLIAEFKKAAVDEGRKGTQQLFQLMRVCCSGLYGETPATRVQLAEEMFSVVNERGLGLGVELHNLLLQVYRHNRHPFSQTEFLEKMKERGVAPNVGTLLLLLESYCQQGNMDGAMQVLEELKKLDVAISEKTYAALVSGYCETGNLAGACGLLDVMVANGLQPDFLTYTALVAGHAFQGEMEKMMKILEDMRALKIYPGMHVYMTIIDSLSRGGHVQHIPQILELIKDKPMVDLEIMDMSRMLAGRNEFQSSLLLLRFLSELPVPRDKVQVTKVGQNLFHHMATSDLPLESLWPVMDELKDMGLPAEHLYDKLIYFFCYQKGQPGFVPDVVRRMHAEGLPVQRHYLYPMFVQGKGDLKILSQGIELLNELSTGIDSQTLHFIKEGAQDQFPSMFSVMKDAGLFNIPATFIATRAMLTSPFLRPYLGSFLSSLNDSVSPGMISSLIINGVRDKHLGVEAVLEVMEVLGSWGNKVSLKILLEKIALMMLRDGRTQNLFILVKNLLMKNAEIVSVSTARIVLNHLSQEGRKEEHEELADLLRRKNYTLGVQNSELATLKGAISAENIPAVLDAFEQLKKHPPKNNLLSISLRAVKLFCSRPDYFSRLPHLLTLLNHDTLPMGMLCAVILDAVRNPDIHLHMQDLVEVLRTLQPLRPADALTELVDRIAFSLSTQKKADEMLALMQPIVQEKIVQVASGAIFSVVHVLLNSGMRTEIADFVALLKEQGIPFQNEYLPLCTKLALQEQNIGLLLDALRITKEDDRQSSDMYPVLKQIATESHFHYLPQVLSEMHRSAIPPGLLCTLILGAIATENILPKDVIELIRSLESWEPNLSRQELIHRIIGIYCDQEKFAQVIELVHPLVEEHVLDLPYKTVHRLVKTLAKIDYTDQNAELMRKLEQLKLDSVDFDMLEMIDGDVEVAMKNWDKLKECEPASQFKCTIRMCKRLCSDPRLFIYLPQFLTLADQSFIPPDVLGAQLSRCMTHIPPPLNLDNVIKVMAVLQDWEPGFSRDELLSSIVNALSRQERVMELWVLVKTIMTKDIMPVSMHVVEQVLANLTRKRMTTEQPNLFELMKAKGMDFDQDRMLLVAATRVGDIDTAEKCFKALKGAGKVDRAACSMVLHLLCKKRWDGSAQRFYHEMVAAGLHPDELSSCDLINRVLTNDNVDFANEIRRNMQERGLPLNMLAYNAFIFAHAKQGNVDAVKQSLREITEANLIPSAVSVKGLMTAYSISGNQDGMLQVQDYLKETSCTPSQFDINMLHVLQNSNTTKPYLFSGFPGPAATP